VAGIVKDVSWQPEVQNPTLESTGAPERTTSSPRRAAMRSTATSPVLERPAGRPTGTPRRRSGPVVALSLGAGLLASVLLAAAPVVPPTEAGVTGALLCGWAAGWALLAVLSRRCTDQPQPWATALALLMGLSGLLLLSGAPVQPALAWVWPPALLALALRALVRVRRLGSRTGRWLLHPLLLGLALVSVAGGAETVRAAAGPGAPPGQLVDVGGHRLHLDCTGTGAPTVVLEPGAGATSAEVRSIGDAVADDTRVCVYDRAGRGWSEPADAPQDAVRIATDLHTALHRAQVPGPYVLAGHSFGGRYALVFTDRYPDEVAGLVLVDATAPGPASPADRGSSDRTDRLAALVSTSARLGVGRLVGVPTAEHARSAVEEYLLEGTSGAQAAALRDVGDRPLAVLTAGRGTAEGWSAEQDALATLSTDSVHRVIEGVDHAGLVMDEAGAAATAAAVVEVVDSVRTGRPLGAG
jgi:pimeloyl-ACP methyl ester carboxylesterase